MSRSTASAVALLLGLILNLAALWVPELAAKWLMSVAIVAYAVGLSLRIAALRRRL